MSIDTDVKNKNSGSNFFVYLLENLQRHSCNLCTYHPFEYVRHMKSHNIVAINTKVGLRPDIIHTFEPVQGIVQDCSFVKYKTPPNSLYVSILPGDVSYIDPVLIGGIFKVCELPVTQVIFDGKVGNELWSKYKLLSTPGSSFSCEFNNSIFHDGILPVPKFHNSILYSTNAGNKLWNMLNFSDFSVSNLQLFSMQP